MCEFCLKHGEGEKWYLQAKNYSDDLFSDIRRRKYIEEFVSHPEALAKDAHNLDLLSRLPVIYQGCGKSHCHLEDEKNPLWTGRTNRRYQTDL